MNKYFIKRFIDEIRRRIPLDYFIGNGHSFPPVRIDIELTHNCNLKCEMCSFVPGNEINKYFSNEYRSYLEKISDYPTLKRWERFFNDVSRFYPTINLSGGEPLLHPKIFDIIKIIKRYRLILTMTTNGTLINDRIAEKIVSSKINGLVISIDGDQKIHNEIRGKNDSFDKALQGIELIRKYKKKMKSDMPRIVINSTISWKNFDDLSFAKKLFPQIMPYKWNFSHLFLGNGDYVKDDISKLYRDRNDIDALNKYYHSIDPDILYKEIIKIKNSKFGEHISFLPELNLKKLKAFYGNPEVPLRKRCLYPYFSCVVQGDGSIITGLYYKIGNIDDNFLRLWNSKKYKDFRSYMKKKLFSKCSRCCGLYE